MGETASGPERVAWAARILARARERHADTHRRMSEVRRMADGAGRCRGARDINVIRQDVRARYDRVRRSVPGNGDPVSSQRRRLDYFDADFSLAAERPAMLAALVDAALALTRAQMGTVQLYDTDAHGLRIAAQRGFDPEFLEYFAFVGDHASAGGAAMAPGRPVLVPDVARSPVYGAGTGRDVMLRAGVGAVLSIPLCRPDGTLLGMLSVHYDRPYEVDASEERVLSLLAASAVRRLTR